MKPRVSVVMPTYKRPALLSRCLAALVRQSLPPDAYEILVVDDGPDIETEDMVKHWRSLAHQQRPGLEITYLTARRAHGPAAARNVGWRAARAPIIAFTDDDTVPARDWLSAGLGAFQSGAVAAWGRVHVPLPDAPTDYERDAAGLDGAVFVTANCFVRWSALLAVGGFDERFESAWREDSDLYFRLLKHYRRVDPAPNALVVHPVRPAPWGVSIRQQRKSLFDALLYKKHPELFRLKIQAHPPYPYYTAVIALIAALIAWLSDGNNIALGFALVWVAVTAEFAIRRLRHTSHSPRHILEMCVTSAAIPLVAIFWRIAGALRFKVFFV